MHASTETVLYLERYFEGDACGIFEGSSQTTDGSYGGH
jgi:hypothetical protein